MSAIPNVAGLPVIGVLIPFARDPLAFVTRAAALGDMVTYRILDQTVVQLNHPDLVGAALVDLAKSMHKDATYELTRPFLGNGLVTSEGEVWRRHRKLLAPSFTPRHIARYAEQFVRGATDWLDSLAEGEIRDAHHDIMMLTQRVVLETLFGADIGVDTSTVASALDVALEGFAYDAHGLGTILPKRLTTPTRRRTARAVVELDQVIAAILAARRQLGLGDDLLSRLIEAHDEEGGLSDTELRDQAVTTFVAGHETTASALTFAFVLLGENPSCWDTLQAEVDRVLGDRLPVADDLAALTYTTAVIEESMRLLPPVWVIGREVQQEVSLGGHTLAPKTQILISQWVLHRDPRWFPDPERFDPGRWSSVVREGLPRMAYLPFGGGPRICIGNHFAMLEAVMILAVIAKRSRLVTTGPRPALFPSVTLRPRGGVPIRVVHR